MVVLAGVKSVSTDITAEEELGSHHIQITLPREEPLVVIPLVPLSATDNAVSELKPI